MFALSSIDIALVVCIEGGASPALKKKTLTTNVPSYWDPLYEIALLT